MERHAQELTRSRLLAGLTQGARLAVHQPEAPGGSSLALRVGVQTKRDPGEMHRGPYENIAAASDGSPSAALEQPHLVTNTLDHPLPLKPPQPATGQPARTRWALARQATLA